MTAQSASRPCVNLPLIRRVTLRNFSLFDLHPEITEVIDKRVHCLAGANGIGKSSFLAAVCFGITGLVPEPGRKFASVDEYHRENAEFAASYFTGRIGESDRENAEISLSFSIGASEFTVARGFFEQGAVRSLHVVDSEGQVLYPSTSVDSMSPIERQAKYQELAANAANVSKFSQLAFLVHFCQTFDERRELLFWSHRELEQALYLTFGISADDALKAGELLREAERLDSTARNEKWYATQIRGRLNDMKRALKSVDLDTATQEDLTKRHKALQSSADKAIGSYDDAAKSVNDCNLEIAQLSAEIERLRSRYETLFSEVVVTSASGISRHPIIAQTYRQHKCGLCGSEAEESVKAIKAAIEGQRCPLCNAEVPKATKEPDLAALAKLDDEISDRRSRLAEKFKAIDRLKAKSARLHEKREKAESDLAQFETDNAKAMDLLRDLGGEELGSVVAKLDQDMKYHLRNAEKAREDRDLKKEGLKKLRTMLKNAYAAAEEEFVPQFKRLAEQFIGIGIDIGLDTTSDHELGLSLEVDGDHRRKTFQLSESQRFFLDIALRMALIAFMTKEKPATFLVDTPEGALDIAYETKAGEMFARYMERGQHILMTANINTSRLLVRLAERCTAEHMKVSRMTDWAQLSSVQEEEQPLFEKALNEIATILAPRVPKPEVE